MTNESRLRIRYTKRGKIRFIGHRDLANIWERALFRARIPVAYSNGFTPHPKISYGLALPVGWESNAEYLDITLARPAEMAIGEVLDQVLPEGVQVRASAEIAGRPRSLASAVAEADYSVWVSDPTGAMAGSEFRGKLQSALDSLMSRTSLLVRRDRRGESLTEDVLPLMKGLQIVESRSDPEDRAINQRYGLKIQMTLATQPRVMRPEELVPLLAEAGVDCEIALVRRESQRILEGGIASDPMDPKVLGLVGAR